MFLHGGAWGSGFPTMYRLLSVPFLEKNYRTAIVGYRTYPDANIEGQVDDIVDAVQYLRQRYPSNRPIVLMAHSSGAHVALTAAVNGRMNQIDAIIGMSGVYDLEAHYEYERSRGLDQISPMAAANGFSTENLRRNSPVLLAQERYAENEHAATSYNFPPTLLLHGSSDDMALPSCSLKLQNALTAAASENNSQNSNSSCQVQVLDGVGHQDTVLQTLLGGKTQTAVFQWIQSELGI
jgi:acetyl esterase/lipase